MWIKQDGKESSPIRSDAHFPEWKPALTHVFQLSVAVGISSPDGLVHSAKMREARLRLQSNMIEMHTLMPGKEENIYTT